jgi:hypothetical protein
VIADGIGAISEENAAALEAMLLDFLQWQPITPSRPRDLAKLLAPLCRFIRADVQAAIADETSALSLLAQEWRAALFPDADNAKFADAYAQTLTYGLLLARVEGQDSLTLINASQALDTNHGLLADALRALGHPNAQRELGTGLDVLLRVLNALDAELWRRPNQSGDNDPWLYFYEDFLAEYDPKLRADAGVYYTPVQVIKAQVRLIDELLRTRFNKPRGFNAPGVNVLDPAAGTGAYPLAVLDHALEAARQRSGPGAVAGAASDLATRLHAFEFLVGPYAVAHLRLTQAVRAVEGHLSAEGALVYLCDTLESPFEPSQPSFAVARLAAEHERARQVKQATPVLVCLGNPPYDRQQRDNAEETLRGGWVRYGDRSTTDGLRSAPLETFLAPARAAGYGGHLKNLYNDYVYFWRWALWKVFEHSVPGGEPSGIVCFITASSYLRGPGFVGMRQAMRETFDELWILDLEGDSRGARPTENVFNIQTGVAIALGIRTSAGNASTPAHVHYAKITGTRAQKLAALDAVQSLGNVTWRDCPSDWLKPFLPMSDAAYWDWPEIMDLFPWQHSGVQFKRNWPIGVTEDVLKERWKSLISAPQDQKGTLLRETGARHIDIQYKDSFTGNKMATLASLYIENNNPSEIPRIELYSFRSFDRQWTIADTRVCDRLRAPLWKSYSRQQVFLTSLLTDVLGTGPAAIATAHIPDLHCFSGRGGKDAIPLWRDSEATQANVTAGLLEKLNELLGVTISAPDLFAYCYALLSPRAYVQTFADELLLPGPRIPLTRDAALFNRVAQCGHELIRVHTFGERDLQSGTPRGEVEAGQARCTKTVSTEPDKYPEGYGYDLESQTLRVGNGEFAPVSPAVWEYSVSGLRVVRSWLDYRKKEPNGRSSSPLDAIRPQSWTMSEELLEVLWTLEHTLEIEPQAEALLRKVIAGDLIPADVLPTPTKAERAAPGGEDGETEQIEMDLE